MFLLILVREEGRWRKTFISCLPHMTQLGIEPTTFQCVGNNDPIDWATRPGLINFLKSS